MLAGANRLRHTRDIERVRSGGRSVGSHAMHVRFAPNGLTSSRATVVVSQRTARRAVVRNKIKRQVRSIVRSLLTKLRPPVDVVIIVHKSALALSFAELTTLLTDMLRRIAPHQQTR